MVSPDLPEVHMPTIHRGKRGMPLQLDTEIKYDLLLFSTSIGKKVNIASSYFKVMYCTARKFSYI